MPSVRLAGQRKPAASTETLVGVILPAMIAPPPIYYAASIDVASSLSSRLHSSDLAVRAVAVEQVLAHPASVDPFDYAAVVNWLWESGRRRQAAFWFYVFQERTRPWALADRNGEGAAALRSSLNDGLGKTINEWIAADLPAWRATALRAIAYEKRFPLHRERPLGLSSANWAALVAKSRAEYDAQATEAFATLKPEELAANRRAAGLPVGPLEKPGPALPDAWR